MCIRDSAYTRNNVLEPGRHNSGRSNHWSPCLLYTSGVQIVFEADKLSNYKDIAKLNVGSAIVVTGELLLTPEAKQPFEIHASEITVEGASTPDYPLQKKRHTMEYLRTIAHLRCV